MAIIKNYGFLWERKYFYRGTGGKGDNAGHLKGQNKSTIVDFREQIGVYALYDKDQVIIYIGQAGNGEATLFTRLKNHMTDDLWNRWEYFSWFGFRDVNATDNSLSNKQTVDSAITAGYKYSDALNEIEGVLIETIEPKLNKRGGNLKNAIEYYQYIDEKVKDVTIQGLIEQISELRSTIDRYGKNR